MNIIRVVDYGPWHLRNGIERCRYIRKDGRVCPISNERAAFVGGCSPKHDPLWNRLGLDQAEIHVLKTALLSRDELPPPPTAPPPGAK